MPFSPVFPRLLFHLLPLLLILLDFLPRLIALKPHVAHYIYPNTPLCFLFLGIYYHFAMGDKSYKGEARQDDATSLS